MSPLLVSGLLVTANITEKFDLKSGDSLTPAASSQDIILYRYPCATNIWAGATDPFGGSIGDVVDPVDLFLVFN